MPSEALSRLLAFDREIQAALPAQRFFAGVDEVGRGPLAGPVVAAAVIVIRDWNPAGLNDSKKVSPAIRQKLFWEISQASLLGLGIVSESEIDRINIYQASRLAMKRAVLALSRTPDFLLIDGNAAIDLPLPQKTVIQGDAKSASIAAASIIAKVYRDAWMDSQDGLYPGYDFKGHKGYATPVHLEKIKIYGPCPIHRRTFSPIKQMIQAMPA